MRRIKFYACALHELLFSIFFFFLILWFLLRVLISKSVSRAYRNNEQIRYSEILIFSAVSFLLSSWFDILIFFHKNFFLCTTRFIKMIIMLVLSKFARFFYVIIDFRL